MLAITLPKDIEERLTNLATETGRTKTFYAREAILNYIEDLEDVYTALKVLENPGETYTLDEVEKICGLDD
jgi:RHH-type transcriptional regulator, rel operon repressor / antitoxin RelB